ncbi:hypothetical protein A5668_09015 [Mycolicibacterium fortuitum]|uniref:DUF4391 domain-containing protein n=1 Tax=Mycolicibacterium fortuitum TaxID=1766 RepID=UPI0007EB772F|nr:DUF4391 domain-containing protein [Mycolicibacterium fortuitum]OBA94696.1 hypothetical protein A5668_09015 [Mycolicibacterium fortuitum]
MTGVLYRWPTAAKFGRVVPKNKFYEHGSISVALREKFVEEIQRITWAYKLAETTINLPGSKDIPEIQVFQIEAKGFDVSEAVLASIDKTVRTPIIFEIVRTDGQVRMTATHKQTGSGAPKLGAYYTTGWHPEDAERQPLPTTITVPALYTALLQPLSGISTRPGEELSEVSARLDATRKLQREIAALERKLRTEPQLNRKVELRRTLKKKQSELEQQR